MNSLTRRRFLLDLAAIGGILAVTAGDQLQARPLPNPELKKKMDDVLDKVFKKPEPAPPHPKQPLPPPPPGPHYPMPGAVPAPPQPPPKS